MAERHDKALHAASFDSVAAVYEASRPAYPQEAVDWLVPAAAAQVADIGAGTGKLTRMLQRPQRHLVAIDPSAHMLEVLHQRLPDVDVRAGSAERVPLGDAAADAITFAQAWHWVDVPRASAQAARVLRPGGTLGLVWNLRDERVDWVRQLGVAMRADGDQFTDHVDAPRVAAPFGDPQRAQFAWTASCSRDGLLDLVRSRSYFAVMTAQEQDATLAAVTELLDAHPQTTGRATLELPYVALCFRYRRP